MNEYRCPSREDWVKLANIFSLEYESCNASFMELYKKSLNADCFYRYPKEQKETTCFGDCNVQATPEKIYSDSQQAIESLDIVDASVDEDDGDDDELDADDLLVDLDTGDLVGTAIQQSDKPSIHSQSFGFTSEMSLDEKYKTITRIFYLRRVLCIRQLSCYKDSIRAKKDIFFNICPNDGCQQVFAQAAAYNAHKNTAHAIHSEVDPSKFEWVIKQKNGINPTIVIDKEASNVHSMTNQSLAGHQYWNAIEPSLVSFFQQYGQRPIYITVKSEAAAESFSNIYFVDSIAIIKRFFPTIERGYSIDNLLKDFAIPMDNPAMRHTSCKDILSLTKILSHVYDNQSLYYC
ncbi:hypothetical protein PPL_11918 [Heterostelium album PN500]|uniref:C2H2-type domain-containing protein n=1 Tax=Heterostelium pallidum (strain ATCC 26659 / Pp 5 / PN500) TaxID=670386 RepID=D3BUU6_HETP5|nr:hypothetical protein PPL_11918 [Heterostelium album PN500]EFA74884.1 hypothetical protein PPL_11918 [Heterostelium album PN500]|eukprot:XP_020427018.1 hypothetical protein PPL_11918 [Heterostelium album PN500]